VTDWLGIFLVLKLIIIPLIWLKLRGEKAGNRKGDYPEPPRISSYWRSYDSMESDIPGVEAPIYAPVRSYPETHVNFLILSTPT
jgi:hypothetical protein